MIKHMICMSILLNTITLIIPQERLNKVMLPTSPAAYMLGTQPNSVLSKESAETLILSIFPNIQNTKNLGLIPNDFAIEFSPYWSSNPKLSLKDYLLPKNIFVEIYRNISLSVASTNHFLLEDSTETNSIAFGLSTKFHISGNETRDSLEKHIVNFRLLQGYRTEVFSIVEEVYDTLNKNDFKGESDPKNEFSKLLKERLKKKLPKIFSSDKHDVEPFVDENMPEIQKLFENDAYKHKNDFILQVVNILTEGQDEAQAFEVLESDINKRQGLSIEFACAGLASFPTNNFDYSVIPRYTMWVTPAYRISSGSIINFLGVVRYETYDTDYYARFFPSHRHYNHNYDLGLSISMEFKRFSMQIEVVRRSSKSESIIGTDERGRIIYTKEKEVGYQYLSTFSYNITKGVSLNYSLGKGYDPVLIDKNVIVSQLSLNLGFGTFTPDDGKSANNK